MSRFLARIIKKRINWIYLVFGMVVVFIAITGRFIGPYDPLAVDTDIKFQPPGSSHWMGTDNLGRDLTSRVIDGTGLALSSGAIILLSATFIGVIIGILSGYYGGLIDEITMRVTDVFIAFPGLVLALAIATALGPNLTNAMIAIAIVWWPSYARLIRGQVLLLKEQPYIQASIALGGGSLWIMLKHILPNVILPLIIQATSDLGPALITTSSLSFIGMGAQPPTPEWGSMVSEGRKYILDYWWISTYPGLAILITVVTFNGIGEAMREALRI